MAVPSIHRHLYHLIQALKTADIHLQVWVGMGQVTATSRSSWLCLISPCICSWVAIVQASKCPTDFVVENGNLVVCIPECIAGICMCCWSETDGYKLL
jgi:hypothetical protein